jgi:hypothetical protein
VKRYHCAICNKKRNESELIKISSDFGKKEIWSCRVHTSNYKDVVSIRTPNKKPVFLELFSGSKHISNHAERLGFEVFNIDFERTYSPWLCSDILKVKESQLPQNVQVVWASIPCTVYSVLSLANHWDKLSIGHRNYFYVPKTNEAINALKILNKTLKIIASLNPVYYFIENPRGALRHFPQMKLIPYRRSVAYSDFGMDYYKPTDIFTNCKSFQPQKLRSCVGLKFSRTVKDLSSAYERSKVPGLLIEELFNSFKHQFL